MRLLAESLMASVTHCLAADRWRYALSFDLSRLIAADDFVLQGVWTALLQSCRPRRVQATGHVFGPGVGRSLPAQLRELSVDCSYCTKMTSQGLEAVAEHLPQGGRHDMTE